MHGGNVTQRLHVCQYRVDMAPPGYATDIKPLFRAQDIGAMSFAFDLGSYEDVRDNAADIYERLVDGSMPCDGAWPAEQLELFREWMEGGSPA
jgi:hypothetical protein